MTKAAIVFRIVDDYLYNAGLLVALLIVLIGVLLCLKASLPRAGRGRVTPQFLHIDDLARRDE